MKIEISKREAEIIEKAMDVWEKEESTHAVMGGMIGAMLGPKDEASKEAHLSRIEKDMKKAQEEGRKRKMESVLLRAKLYQSMASESKMDDAEGFKS